MEKMIKKLVLYMVKNNIIQYDIDTIECYEYGMTLVVSSVIVFIAMIVCSLPSNLALECCIFAVSFCPIRALAGGYHCKRFWSCFLISLAYWLLLEVLLIANNYLLLSSIIIAGILSGGVYCTCCTKSRRIPYRCLFCCLYVFRSFAKI